MAPWSLYRVLLLRFTKAEGYPSYQSRCQPCPPCCYWHRALLQTLPQILLHESTLRGRMISSRRQFG
jgi:hypothetical protein